ncbi:MAG: hypothetical protein AAFN27_22290 [Pseudomonadota bacterium]
MAEPEVGSLEYAIEYANKNLPSLKLQLAVSAAPLVLIISKIESFADCDSVTLKLLITFVFVTLSASVVYLGYLIFVVTDIPSSAMRARDDDVSEERRDRYIRSLYSLRRVDDAILRYRASGVAISYLLVMGLAMVLLWNDACAISLPTQSTKPIA